MNSLLTGFAELTVAFAGLAIGLCALIVARYWVVFRRSHDGARLLPAHVMLIGTSYAMLAFVGVARLGSPPHLNSMTWTDWWVYPFITVAFLMGDAALLLILRFTARRGARYGRRTTDPEV